MYAAFTGKNGAGQTVSQSTPLPVGGKVYRSAVTITRPSDTTAYAAGDVVGDTSGSAIITLAVAGPAGGSVLVQSASLLFSDNAVPIGAGAFRLHLYSVAPTAIADNAPFDLVGGDRAGYLGYVDLSAPADLGSSLYSQADYSGRLVQLATGSTSCYVEIETRSAFTPVSASTVTLVINALEAGL
jgi:hypothetical protein